MNGISFGKLAGFGTIGTLSAATFIAHLLNSSLVWLFGTALAIVVIATAISIAS